MILSLWMYRLSAIRIVRGIRNVFMVLFLHNILCQFSLGSLGLVFVRVTFKFITSVVHVWDDGI